MTTPGNANLGIAYGKVRIDYESTGVAKAAKDVESLQSTLVDTGKQMGQLAKSTGTAVAQINQFGAQTAKIGKGIKNPAEGLGAQVTKEVSQAQKSLTNLQKQLDKGLALQSNIKVIAREITVDRASFNGAIQKWQASQNVGTLAISANLKIVSTNVTIDSSSFRTAITNLQRNTQNISATNTMALRVGLVADMQQVQALAVRIRDTFGRIASDQTAYGAAAANRFAAGWQSGAGALNLAASNSGRSAGESASGAMGLAIKGGLAVAAGAASTGVAAVGYVLKKGFDRLEGLDTAAAKLKALGFQTQQIQAISKDALASVKGTAFGLDQAFNAAANAISAGIKPGKELEDYLKNVADNAALAQVSMQDMGDIFNQVAVEGKLTGDVVDSLQSRGVDVFGNLAKSMKITQSAAQEMVTNGQIDFAKFRAAMNLNAGAAVTMGQTISGSWDNLQAAIGRIGALFLKPIFGDANGQMSTVARAIQWITNKLGELESWMSANQGKIVSFWEVMGKGALYVLYGLTALSTGVTGVLTGITKTMSFFAGKWADLFEKIPGMDGVAKSIRGVSKDLSDMGDSTWEATKDQVGFMGTLDKGLDSIGKWADGVRNGTNNLGALGDAAKSAAPPTQTLADILKKFGVKENEFLSGLQGTTKEFKELMKTLKEKGASDQLLNMIKQMRSDFTSGGYAVKGFADAVDKLADPMASASDKADTLLQNLKDLGVIPNDDAIEQYSEYITKLGDAAQQSIDPLSALGDSLVAVDGSVSKTAGKNAQQLYKTLVEAREEFTKLAASGTVSPDEAYGNIQKNLQDALTSNYQLSPEAAQRLIDKYLPKQGLLGALNNPGDPAAAAKSVFGNNPAELESVLKMLTTQQDLLKQIVPEGVLKIPSQIVLNQSGLGGVYDILSQLGFGNDRAGVSGTITTTGGGSQVIPNATPPQQGPYIPNANEKDPGLGKASGYALSLGQNPGVLANALSQNPIAAQVLQPYIQAAQVQGENFAEAFAAGIAAGDDAVKRAIIEIAQTAGDGLGHSPALYGPLSGKGWTLERGKVFTRAFASGISSVSSDVKGAVSSVAQASVVPLDDKLTQTIKDMEEFSGLGKRLFDVAKQIGDIALGSLKFANDISGGRLFPKHYVKDPSKTGKPSTTTYFDPQLKNPNTAGIAGAGSLPANAGKQDIANYIISKALSQGYSRDQANAIATQAFGESGFNPDISGGQQGSDPNADTVLGIFQEKPAFAQSGGIDPSQRTDAKANIDAYFNNLAAAGGPNTDDIKGLLASVSGGGPAHPSNAGHWDKAVQGVAPYLQGYSEDTITVPLPKVGINPKPSAPQGGSKTPKIPLTELEKKMRSGGMDPNGNMLPIGWTGKYAPGMGPTEGSLVNNNMDYEPAPAISGKKQPPLPASSTPTPQPQKNTISVPVPQNGSGTSILHDSDGRQSQAAAKYAAQLLQEAFPELTNIGGARNDSLPMHPAGRALDVMIPKWDTPEGKALGDRVKKWAMDNAGNIGLDSVIWQDFWQPADGSQGHLLGKMGVSPDEAHLTHNHLAFKEGFQPDQNATISGMTPGALQGITTSLGIPALVRSQMDKNPDLKMALNGGDGITPERRLQMLDVQIADAQRLGTPEGKSLADYYSGARSRIMDQNGLKEAPSDLDTIQSIVSGGSGVITDIFGVVDSSLKSIGAAKDIGDKLVRGVSNTGELSGVIDDFQNFLDLGSKIAQLTSSISGFAGSMVGAAGSGDTSGTSQGVAMALGAVSTISGLVGQGFAAANAVIDLGQEIAKIAGKYAGRAITSMLGFPGASDMNFLLDTVTGQLQAYTSDNPQDKHTFDTLGRQFNPGKYAGRQAPTNTFYIYQGPGQDPRDTMSNAMFAIKSSGQGAFGYAE